MTMLSLLDSQLNITLDERTIRWRYGPNHGSLWTTPRRKRQDDCSMTPVGERARASDRSLLFTAPARRQRGRGKGYFLLLLLLLLRNRRGRVDRLRSLKLRRRRRLRSVGARRSGTPTVAPPHPLRLIS